jgi:serine/threonine-protein kinase
MDTDRNLLFGVLALQADFIDAAQFAEICSAWSTRKDTSLGVLIQERGWITAEDRADVERLLERKLRKHSGDARATLAGAADDRVRALIAAVDDPELKHSIGVVSSRTGPTFVSTIAYQPETRDRYTLTRLHAKGGLGQVWLARDADLGREVALKELRPERADDPAVWARFLDEARINGQLEHPSIVPVHELSQGDAERRPFYTMRFVRGRTMNEAIRDYHKRVADGKAEPMALAGLLNAFVCVGNAVAYAHSRGVVHRDLKGQNVILGDFGEVILLDWGLAKVLSAAEAKIPRHAVTTPGSRDATMHGQALGTPSYMAPEQAEGRLEAIDARTDVYGMGAILYEILTGRAPFDGSDTAEVLRKVVAEEPPRPRQVCPTAPVGLEAVCLRAIAKRPEQRYASVLELAEDVKRWLADEPVSVYREPPLKRMGRWSRRHRTMVAGAVALLLTAVTALAIGTVLLGKANARIEAQKQLADANFKRARRAVDEFFTRVSESTLLEQPGLQPLRRQLLQDARKYYQEFSSQRADDPEILEELAATHFRLAMVDQALGHVEDAAAAYRHSDDLTAKLVGRNPAEFHLRSQRSKIANNIGTLLMDAGRTDESRVWFERAIAIDEDLLKTHPGDADLRGDLARQVTNLARTALVAGDSKSAESHYRRALSIRETLATERSDDIEARAALARAHNGLGVLFHDRHSELEAIGELEKALAIERELTKRPPSPAEHRKQLTNTLRNLANCTLRLAKLPESLAYYAEAREVLGQLAEQNPAVVIYQYDLAELCAEEGEAQRQNNREDEALKLLDRARDLRVKLAATKPDDADFASRLAHSYGTIGELLVRAGRTSEGEASYHKAIQILDDRLRQKPKDRDVRSALAHWHFSLGYALQTQQKLQPAFDELESARQLYAALASERPNDSNQLGSRAQVENNLGAIHEERGQPEQALACYRRAMEFATTALNKHPTQTSAMQTVSSLACNLARALTSSGHAEEGLKLLWEQRERVARDPDALQNLAWGLTLCSGTLVDKSAAIVWSDRSRELLEGIVRDHPERLAAQSLLGGVLNDLAMRLARSGQTEKAIEPLEAAIEHQRVAFDKEPANAQYHRFLCNHYGNLYQLLRNQGRITDAIAMAEARAKIMNDAVGKYFFAEAIAYCIPEVGKNDAQLDVDQKRQEQQRLADRALDILREAFALKFDHVDWLRQSRAWDPLRSRKDFAELIEQGGAKSDH